MPMIMREAKIVVHRGTSGAVSDHSIATGLPFAKVYAGVKPTVSSMPLGIRWLRHCPRPFLRDRLSYSGVVGARRAHMSIFGPDPRLFRADVLGITLRHVHGVGSIL